MSKKLTTIFSFCTLLTTAAFGQNLISTPQVSLETFATGLSTPVAMTHAGDDRLFVCEQNSGRVRILNADGDIIGTFIDVSADINTGGERGLLGIAFHPDYSENGYFFLNYTNNSNDTEIIRYTVSEDDPNDADENSGQIVLRIDQPYTNHNAGSLAFGPDGYLYIPMGDGGDGGDPNNYAQTPTTMLGKILRIDVNNDDFPEDEARNYSIPDGNPFIDDSAVLDEIWALGLRNPWKFSFDRETGDLWMGDVGQNAYEEVNMQPASSTGGENYGWRCFEGFHNYNTTGCDDFEDYTAPVFEMDQDDMGWCSVIGGYVYRGENNSLLQGRFLFTDYCGGQVFTLHQNTSGEWVEELVNTEYAGFFAGFTGFGEDVNGELYLLRNGGTILRLEETCSASIPEITADGALLTSTEGESYQWLLNGEWIEDATAQTYTAEENGNYSVIVEFANGCEVESEAIMVTVTSLAEHQAFGDVKISPNPGDGLITVNASLETSEPVTLWILDQTGREIFTESIGMVSGSLRHTVDIRHLSPGIYYLKMEVADAAMVQRVAVVR